MNKRICDFVSPRTEPDFFDHPDPDLQEVQDEIRRGIETASEVMTITVDQEVTYHRHSRWFDLAPPGHIVVPPKGGVWQLV